MFAFALLGLPLFACAGDDAQPAADAATLCAQATQHVRDCMPGEAVETPASCDAASAQATLGTSCETLASGGGKGDGLCNPWLWWTCVDGGSGTTGFDFWVSVNVCYDDLCDAVTGGASCGLLTLTDADGEEVARAWTGSGSNARFEGLDLPDGTYALTLYRNDGSVAEMTTVEDNGFFRSGREPAILPVVLRAGEEPERPRFYLAMGEEESVRRCARVNGEVEASCGGAEVDAEETEWTWFVRLSGEDERGPVSELSRAFRRYQEPNGFAFLDVMPGTYTLDFIEMDIPSYARENNPDYAYLVDRYATDNVYTSDFEVTTDDQGATLELGTFELQGEGCD